MADDATTLVVDRSLADLADPERLAAERPSHRLFRAHPELGLEEAEDAWLPARRPHQLGVRWLALGSEEQWLRQADFLRALLERAARAEESYFEAAWADEERTIALARRCGANWSTDATTRGPLSDRAVAVLADDLPELLAVDGGSGLAIVTLDGWDALGVWIDRWKGPELERELQDAWWVAARARAEREEAGHSRGLRRRQAADRELRAHLFVGWKRAQSILYAILMAGSIAVVWGDGFLDLLKAIGSTIAVLWAIDALVERWYWRASKRPHPEMRAGGH